MLCRMTIAAPPHVSLRLLTRVARRWAVGLAVVLGAFVVALGAEFAGARTATQFDIHVMLHLYSWYPDRHAVAHRVADLGGSAAVAGVTLVLAVVLYATQRYRAALLALLGPV